VCASSKTPVSGCRRKKSLPLVIAVNACLSRSHFPGRNRTGAREGADTVGVVGNGCRTSKRSAGVSLLGFAAYA
jgi:hypothetical protein